MLNTFIYCLLQILTQPCAFSILLIGAGTVGLMRRSYKVAVIAFLGMGFIVSVLSSLLLANSVGDLF